MPRLIRIARLLAAAWFFVSSVSTGAHADNIVIGIHAAIVFNPSTLAFPLGPFGVPSAPQTVTATNVSPYAVSFPAITITGTNAADFTETDNCGSALQPGARCLITVVFTPTVNGPETANISIVGNPPAHTYTVAARGGSAYPVAITLSSPAALFDNTPAGTLVTTATVTTSDNSPYMGTLSIGASDPAPSGQQTYDIYAISGLTVVTSRQLTQADDGSHPAVVTAN